MIERTKCIECEQYVTVYEGTRQDAVIARRDELWQAQKARLEAAEFKAATLAAQNDELRRAVAVFADHLDPQDEDKTWTQSELVSLSAAVLQNTIESMDKPIDHVRALLKLYDIDTKPLIQDVLRRIHELRAERAAEPGSPKEETDDLA